MKIKCFKLILCLATLSFYSCASHKNASLDNLLKRSNCNQQNIYTYNESDLPQPLSTQQIASHITQTFNSNTLNLANAIGIIPSLNSYVQLIDKRDSTLAHQIKLLKLKQSIDQRIHNASLVVSAVSSEMDCEEERTSQIANYLNGKKSDLESKLTIGAIVVGASGAIATGGTIKNEKLSNGIGIATGITEATLGLLMLFNKRSIQFYYERNALSEIWYGRKTSKLFPAFIWYYLTFENSLADNSTTIREQIIDKWTTTGQLDLVNDAQKSIDLYFGSGGKYNADQLENRADMYDQLESHINLLKQELMTLANAVDKL